MITWYDLKKVKEELDKLPRPDVIYIPMHPYYWNIWKKYIRHFKRYTRIYERRKGQQTRKK